MFIMCYLSVRLIFSELTKNWQHIFPFNNLPWEYQRRRADLNVNLIFHYGIEVDLPDTIRKERTLGKKSLTLDHFNYCFVASRHVMDKSKIINNYKKRWWVEKSNSRSYGSQGALNHSLEVCQ